SISTRSSRAPAEMVTEAPSMATVPPSVPIAAFASSWTSSSSSSPPSGSSEGALEHAPNKTRPKEALPRNFRPRDAAAAILRIQPSYQSALGPTRAQLFERQGSTASPVRPLRPDQRELGRHPMARDMLGPGLCGPGPYR